jgi:hypothetical protein
MLLMRALVVAACAGTAACGNTILSPAPPLEGWSAGTAIAETPCSLGGTAKVGLALDDQAVYFSTGCGQDAYNPNGVVMRAPLGGGAAVSLTGPEFCVDGIAARDGQVYFLTGCTGKAMRVPSGGGTTEQLSDLGGCPHDLVLDGDAFYVAGDAWMWPGVIRVPLDGSTPTGVTGSESSGGACVVVYGTAVYWTGFTGLFADPGGMLAPTDMEVCPAAGPAGVFFTKDNRLMKLPAGGGAAVELAATTAGAVSIAIDGDTVYWADPAGVHKVPAGGGTATTISSYTPPDADSTFWWMGITVDATRVYWTTPCGVMAAPK